MSYGSRNGGIPYSVTFLSKTHKKWFRSSRSHSQTREVKPRKYQDLPNHYFLKASRCSSRLYVDKITSGFLMWEPTVKAYTLPNVSSPLSLVWEVQSQPALDVIASVMKDVSYFSGLLSLWAQEDAGRGAMNTDLEFRCVICKLPYVMVLILCHRSDNVLFIKTIGMIRLSPSPWQKIANLYL